MPDTGQARDETRERSYRCGRCGYSFTTTSHEEYVELYSEHYGVQCLAILGRFDADSVRILANDITRLMDRSSTVEQLLHVLEMMAKHKETL